MKSATYSTLLVAILMVLTVGSPSFGAVVAQWDYDTQGGAPVSDGQSAVGQVDETGGFAGGPFHLTGFGGTLSYQQGAFSTGHALQFTEATSPMDYVAVTPPPTAIKDIALGAFTIETWFKTTDSGRGVLFGSFYGTTANDLNFEIINGKIRGHIGGPGGITDFQSSGHSDVDDGQWHHAAFVRQSAGGSVQLYLDGFQRGAATDKAGNSFSLNASTLYLGRDYRTDSTRFDGLLDNTRVSNMALSPAEFNLAGAGEQNYYRMETDGGVAVGGGQTASVVDDTGHHPFTYNGTALPATPSYSTDVVAKTIQRGSDVLTNDHSLSFNGAGDYVELGNQSLLRTLTEDDFTIEFFLKTPSRNDRGVVIGTYDGSTVEILNLEIGGATHGANQGHLRPFFQGTTGSFDDFWGDTDIADDEWHHVALVRSGAGTGSDLVQLFVDYELDGQMTLGTGQYTLRPTFFRLGRDSRGSGFYYEGLLDEFRISRGALGVSEFLQPLSAVPEPSSFILWGLGTFGLLCARRRRLCG